MNQPLRSARHFYSLAFALLAVPTLATAQTKLAPPFTDHAVLQRDKPLTLWGTAAPNAKVTLTLATQTATTTADASGHWSAQLPPIPAGGPYTLKAATPDSSAEATDILLGDVFLCSGQSNMQFSLQEAIGGPELATHAADLGPVRLCTLPKAASDKPETGKPFEWKLNSPDAAKHFAAVGYYFANELRQHEPYSKVPLGLIDSSFGGTMVEGWIPKQDLAAFAPKDLYDSMFGIKPTGLYNAMIAPLGPSAYKAVVWYQGEGNSGHPENYAQKLEILFASWRKQFQDPALPFVVVSLPDYLPKWGDYYWSWFREVQARAVADTPNTAIALAINTTDGTDLHPKEKQEIGRRVACALREVAYHEPNYIGHGPLFKSAQPTGSSIRVTFDTAGRGLATVNNAAPQGFMLAGDDGLYRYATAKIEGDGKSDTVSLQSDLVPNPKTVRYAWAGVPHSNLITPDNLPAAPFRTDMFAPASLEVQPQPPTRHVETSVYDIVIDSSGKITSLRVGGKQFLSTDGGTDGGTSVPGWLGPRSLSTFHELGPDLVSYGDTDITLTLAFQESKMTWTLTNTSKDELTFRLVLAPGLTAKGSPADTVSLTRDNAHLILQGADKLTPAPSGAIAEIHLKPHSTHTLHLTAIK